MFPFYLGVFKELYDAPDLQSAGINKSAILNL